MATPAVNQNFIVQNQFWTKDNEQAVRYIEKAICLLDPARVLSFSFQHKPVFHNEGGTQGPRPVFKVSQFFSDMESYNKSIETETGNPEIMATLTALTPFAQNFTRMFYELVHKSTPSDSSFSPIDPSDILNEDEKNLLSAEEEKMVPAPSVITLDEHSFCLLHNPEPSNASDDAYAIDLGPRDGFEQKVTFHVQNSFWAKPGFEEIARKTSKYLCAHIDSNRDLFFPFNVTPEHASGAGTVGTMPAYIMIGKYGTLREYTTSVEQEVNDPTYIAAMKILNICVQSRSRQFWLHEMN